MGKGWVSLAKQLNLLPDGKPRVASDWVSKRIAFTDVSVGSGGEGRTVVQSATIGGNMNLFIITKGIGPDA